MTCFFSAYEVTVEARQIGGTTTGATRIQFAINLHRSNGLLFQLLCGDDAYPAVPKVPLGLILCNATHQVRSTDAPKCARMVTTCSRGHYFHFHPTMPLWHFELAGAQYGKPHPPSQSRPMAIIVIAMITTPIVTIWICIVSRSKHDGDM